ncbi:response regulator [Aestuariispira ectoiniformans]|uniref:response regulator n=1 Tax=Aestuariispira ectoiniformans TaxID=2775080 RepID=UPI00223AC331|nr:response regulator [Aestuariispira ectoiniformans]
MSGQGRSSGKASAVIFFQEEITDVRRQTRNVLNQAGFSNVQELKTQEDIRAAFVKAVPDLLILDSSMEDVTGLIRDIRFNRAGVDPFMPIFVTLWNPSSEDIKAIVQSGPDDILVKPLAPKTLLDRIKTVIQSRKVFVFTENYVGPDRRKDLLRAKDGPYVRPVPNRLAARVLGKAYDMADHKAACGMIPSGRTQSTTQGDRTASNASR